MLHLHEEAPISAPIGGSPSVGSRTLDNFNDEAPALHSKQTLCSNPTVSNVHAVIYSLFTIFHQLSRGTMFSAPQPLYDRFPYDLTSLVDAYDWGLWKVLTPP
jgi:hypothetical protein